MAKTNRETTTYGELLRATREFLGLTLPEMAQELGVSRRTYWSYETGKTEPSGQKRDNLLMLLAQAQKVAKRDDWSDLQERTFLALYRSGDFTLNGAIRLTMAGTIPQRDLLYRYFVVREGKDLSAMKEMLEGYHAGKPANDLQARFFKMVTPERIAELTEQHETRRKEIKFLVANYHSDFHEQSKHDAKGIEKREDWFANKGPLF